MASRGLRTLCLAYADVSADKVGPLDKLEGPPQLPLIACCMLGIKVSVLTISVMVYRLDHVTFMLYVNGYGIFLSYYPVCFIGLYHVIWSDCELQAHVSRDEKERLVERSVTPFTYMII